jgi:hypothetical protein
MKAESVIISIKKRGKFTYGMFRSVYENILFMQKMFINFSCLEYIEVKYETSDNI